MALTRKQLLAGFGGKSRQKAARSGRKTSKGKSAKATPSRKSPKMSKLSSLRQRINVKRIATRAGAGALASYAPTVAGDFGPGLALTGVGLATNDPQVEAMGEVALGAAVARAIGGAAGYAPPTGGNGLL